MQQRCAVRDVRASTLDQSLRKLGVERLSKEDVQKMQWEALEGKIVSWNQYMHIARFNQVCSGALFGCPFPTSKLVKMHFRQSPIYTQLLEIFNDVEHQTASGQMLDLITTPAREVDHICDPDLLPHQ